MSTVYGSSVSVDDGYVLFEVRTWEQPGHDFGLEVYRPDVCDWVSPYDLFDKVELQDFLHACDAANIPPKFVAAYDDGDWDNATIDMPLVYESMDAALQDIPTLYAKKVAPFLHKSEPLALPESHPTCGHHAPIPIVGVGAIKAPALLGDRDGCDALLAQHYENEFERVRREVAYKIREWPYCPHADSQVMIVFGLKDKTYTPHFYCPCCDREGVEMHDQSGVFSYFRS